MIQYTQFCDPLIIRPEKYIVEKLADTVLVDNNVRNGEISFIFGSDDLLVELKKEFFYEDHLTDVIAFRLNDYKEAYLEGEIYISLPRATENSKKYGEPFEKEVARLIVHGSLHLLGHKDDTRKQKEKMRIIEDKYLDLVDWKILFGE